MRLSWFLIGAALLVAYGLLGFRIIDLEQRVEVLSAQNNPQAPEPNPAGKPSATSAAATVPKDLESRLQSIERRLTMLESFKSGLSIPGSPVGEDRLKQEQAILSVVERENSRIREVQLEWHKARWLETRKQQLAAFAYTQQLEPAQTAKVYEALESELNRLAEVMKRPAFAEDPDQAASDWLKILGETDQRAHDVLTPAQYQTWVIGRLFERRVIWPWLPEQETAQN